jgi:hypothetical protein
MMMRKNLLAMAFGVALALLFIEIVFRLLPGFLPLEVQLRTGRTGRNLADLAMERYQKAYYALFYNDPYLGVAYKPNLNVTLRGHPDYTYHMRTVTLGYEGIGFRDDGIHGPVYAVAVGDSFTAGEGVEEEETWVERLQERVGQDVINLGVSRYASTQNERMLIRYGLPLRPRLVLWGFFPNDFYGEWIIRRWLASGEPDIDVWWAENMENAPSPNPDQAVPAQKKAAPAEFGSGLRGFLHHHSISYELLKFGLRLGDYRRQGEVGPDGSLLYNDARLHLAFRPDAWERWLNQDETTIRQTQEPIRAARQEAEAQGAAFVLLLFPCKEAVYWDLLKPRLSDPNRLDLERPMRLMLDFCTAERLRCLDLTPAFRQRAAQGEQLYFRLDGHWNAAGHALAADIIYEYLAAQGLLPAP